MVLVNKHDFDLAFDAVSEDEVMEAWVSLKTGEVVVSNGHESEEYDELPEDLGEPGRYVEGPRARELDLGARLVMRFVAERMADAVDEVLETLADTFPCP